MKWHAIKNLKQSASNEITAKVEIEPDSPWFSGHFPGDPILPGIAQLGIIFEAIEQSSNQKLVVSGFSRVRFKQGVRSQDQLSIVITPVEKNAESYSFQLLADEEPACRGIIYVKTI